MSKFQKLFKKNYSNSKTTDKISGTSGFLRINISICVFIFFAAVAYLSQVNGLANLSYSVQKLEQEANKIETANTKLLLEAAKLQSITEIKKASIELGLVEVDKIIYIDHNDLTIAIVK